MRTMALPRLVCDCCCKVQPCGQWERLVDPFPVLPISEQAYPLVAKVERVTACMACGPLWRVERLRLDPLEAQRVVERAWRSSTAGARERTQDRKP